MKLFPPKGFPDPEQIFLEPIRVVNIPKNGDVLNDIDGQLPAGHQYTDKDRVTWAHETSHGISSRIRNANNGKVNGFYTVDGGAILVAEPKICLTTWALNVPPSLRGDCWRFYLTGRQAQQWDDRPLYMYDEWNAYLLGSICGVDLVQKGLLRERRLSTLLKTVEFGIYALCCVGKCFDASENFARFTSFQIARTLELASTVKRVEALKKILWEDAIEVQWNRFLQSPDTELIREGLVRDFGSEWAGEVLHQL